MNVAQLLAACLENEGVRYVFGVPGEENEATLFALEDSPVTFVPTRHEQGAAFMANVWGRLTGRAGVCLSTLGPGATNLLTGLADAHLDKAPVVALTAQGARDRLHHESHQALDVVELLRPVTKWNTTIRHPRVVPEVMRKAFKVAEEEKPGVTHLELPEDVADEDVEAWPMEPRSQRRPGPDPRAVAEAATLVADADRPVILAGNGVIRNGASGALTRLVESAGLPVMTTFMAKGAVSDRLPHSLRTVGLGFRDVVMDAVDEADLIVAVGFDVAELPPERLDPDGEKSWVHVDYAPAEVYDSYDPLVEVVSDVGDALEALTTALAKRGGGSSEQWWAPIRERIDEDIRRDRLAPDDGLHVPGALHVIRGLLPDDGLLLSDVGSHKMWIARNFPAYHPGSVLVSNGLASMGIALPGAIAASLVDPQRPIVACMGDGGSLMNVQELETARRVSASFVAIVLDDQDYGLISWKQRRHRQRSTGTYIDNPDFVDLARSFGHHAERVETPRALEKALAEALSRGGVTVLHVPVDPSVNDALVERLGVD